MAELAELKARFDKHLDVDFDLDPYQRVQPQLLGKRLDRAVAELRAELVDLVSTIGFGATPGETREVLGPVHEYFLGMFASAEGKRGGQFCTPRRIVKTLVAVLAPHHGKVCDPCCGSGDMFVQSEAFIEAHGGTKGDVAIYGQEANPTTVDGRDSRHPPRHPAPPPDLRPLRRPEAEAALDAA